MGRKSKKFDEEGDEISSEIKSRTEFKSGMAEKVIKMSRSMIERKENPFGDDEVNKGKRKNRKMKDVDLETKKFTWNEAEKLFRENSHAGLHKVRETRHVALPYHQITNIKKSLEYITNEQIGKFRRQVRGVLMAVGEIGEVRALRIVDDHSVFHFDAVIQQIVFRPQKEMMYETTVTMTSPRIITSCLFGSIAVTSPLDEKAKDILKGIQLRMGDVVMVKYQSCTVKRSLVVLQATLVRVIKRSSNSEKTQGKKKKFDEDEENDCNEDGEEDENEKAMERSIKKEEPDCCEMKMEVDEEELEAKEKKAKKKRKSKRDFED